LKFIIRVQGKDAARSWLLDKGDTNETCLEFTKKYAPQTAVTNWEELVDSCKSTEQLEEEE